MKKKYIDKNVLEAAEERLEYAFNEFDNIYFSFSGGKDSSVMVQLAAKVAKKMNKKFSILIIDLEAQYKMTIEHIEEVLKKLENMKVLNQVYWVCLPLSVSNGVSIFQERWTCWNEKEKEKWVRKMPENKYIINEKNNEWKWYRSDMNFNQFVKEFGKWFNQKNGGITGAGIGIRAQESLKRYSSIVSDTKNRFRNLEWTTKIKGNEEVYNFYPIYDFETEDDWGVVAKYNLLYNKIYDLMYQNGVHIHEQRLCQPYGPDQKQGLDQFKALEPETWEKVEQRVSGVNFGNIYCKTELTGVGLSRKEPEMSWQEYGLWLLQTLELVNSDVFDIYYKKIDNYFKNNDAGDEVAWKIIARAIEKNDYSMKELTKSTIKYKKNKAVNIKNKYMNI